MGQPCGTGNSGLIRHNKEHVKWRSVFPTTTGMAFDERIHLKSPSSEILWHVSPSATQQSYLISFLVKPFLICIYVLPSCCESGIAVDLADKVLCLSVLSCSWAPSVSLLGFLIFCSFCGTVDISVTGLGVKLLTESFVKVVALMMVLFVTATAGVLVTAAGTWKK